MSATRPRARHTPLVVIASADAAVADALARRLRRQGVLAYATHSAEGCLRVATSVRPDVVLLDWEQPDLSAERLLPALRSACPGLRVVALGDRPDARPTALAAGADYFVAKSDPPETLLTCLRALAQPNASLRSAA